MKCIYWKKDHIELIDQTKLPAVTQWIKCEDVPTLGEAIKKLSIRGAPALGIAAAMGMALAAAKSQTTDLKQLKAELKETGKYIASTRPTAVNLFWALERIMKIVDSFEGSVDDLKAAIEKETIIITVEDEKMCKAIGDHGATVVKEGWSILTHCNAGFLATGDYGTALGVIRSAHYQGKKIHVYSDETRPLLQGARLTAWELGQDGIPYTLIADNMAGYLMKQGKINMVVTGADRIAANGDTANKIGTYSVAVLAKHHGIPFYIAAPYSTIDLKIKSGEEIVIEERKPEEVRFFQGVQSAPADANVYNPAFDVTPHELITGIITERGIMYPPYTDSLAGMHLTSVNQ
ncbi:MAG: S-methyl-5-thioribose-1-phosphate isomerase [Firmicutes bacterium]|nr:S-methyl-5-thioribose-1-phosphate isomerase [Bacillota bacterium]